MLTHICRILHRLFIVTTMESQALRPFLFRVPLVQWRSLYRRPQALTGADLVDCKTTLGTHSPFIYVQTTKPTIPPSFPSPKIEVQGSPFVYAVPVELLLKHTMQ